MIWSKEESLSREEMEGLQLARLQETVARVYEKVPYYRAKMQEKGITPQDIQSLADLQKLPFTTKQDMRDTYPFGLFAVPQQELVRIHASSGTTGKPTVVGYTRGDLDVWTDCVSRIACMGGATEKDVAQICFGYGMFTGALGLHYGLEKIGAAIVPSSTGNSEKQIMYMQDFNTSLLVATPSYALRLAEVARDMGVDPRTDLSVKTYFFGKLLQSGLSVLLTKLFFAFRAQGSFLLQDIRVFGVVSGICLLFFMVLPIVDKRFKNTYNRENSR